MSYLDVLLIYIINYLMHFMDNYPNTLEVLSTTLSVNHFNLLRLNKQN